ncbi:DUF6427 family protein [Algibacter mikhailovii]|nr:DUF6427 family protein [Algibacter mikhailovii]
MITSFFNKSKPTNFIIVFVVTLLAFVLARKSLFVEGLSFEVLMKQLVLVFVALVSILLLNFIASKNSLTNKSNYEVLLFSLFLLYITETTNNANILVSNFFVLLGLRRIISLHSQKDIKKKLFDAAFWIGVASLFYFWSILFFILIIVTLMLYPDKNLRHWIVPFLGILTVFVISCAVSLVVYNNYFEIFNYPPGVSYDFSNYNALRYLVAITVLLSFGIWSSFFYLQNIRKQKKRYRVSFKSVIVAALIGFIILVLAPDKDGGEFIFLFAPLSIIIANYIEIIQDKWFKELFLSVLVVLPFILLLL